MLPFEEIEKMVGSRYALTVLAGKRARQLRDGSPQLVNSQSSNPILIALQEILEGKIQPENLEYIASAPAPQDADTPANAPIADADLAILTDADAAGVELPGAADITGAPVNPTSVEEPAAPAPMEEDAQAASVEPAADAGKTTASASESATEEATEVAAEAVEAIEES